MASFVDGGAMIYPGKQPWLFLLNHTYSQQVVVDFRGPIMVRLQFLLCSNGAKFSPKRGK
ncbi:MAG: hypothetical protein K2W97_08105 [Chthoniobacterales bacterium]|nr:hypothetical protein [Chthoniobacterales bacterium]